MNYQLNMNWQKYHITATDRLHLSADGDVMVVYVNNEVVGTEPDFRQHPVVKTTPEQPSYGGMLT